MKHPRTKVFLTTLLAAAFVLAFAWIVTMQNRSILLSDASGKETLKLEAVSHTLEDLDSSWDYVEAKMKERYEVDATLSALALRNVIKEEGDKAIARYENGAVIKADEDGVKTPGNIGKKLGLNTALFESDKGLFPSPVNDSTLVIYSRIGYTDYYFIQWYENTKLPQRVEETVDFPAILQKAETSYDVYAILAAEDKEGSGKARILYCNDLFKSYDGIEGMGLSLEGLAQDAGSEPRTLVLDGDAYQYVVGRVDSLNGYVILLLRQPNLYITALAKSGFTIAVVIVFLSALLVTGFSLYGYVRDNALTLEMERRYAPFHVRRIAVLYGIIGTICVGLCCILIYALNGLYDESAKGKDRLRILEENMAVYGDRYATNVSEFRDIYLDHGTHIAELLDNYPELRTRDVLQDLADSICASSITLYNCNADETVSSSEYIDLSLGEDPSSATWAFRQLLKGTKSVVKEAETDEVTGLHEVRLGIRIRDDSEEGRYGAMILSLDPEGLNRFLPNGIDRMLQDLSGPGCEIWVCDPETGTITASSNHALEGRNITELGLDKSDLKGGVIRKTASEEGNWFVTSIALKDPGILKWTDAYQDAIVFYAVSDSSTNRGMASSALASCVSFIAIYAILALIILSEYTDAYFDEWKKQWKRKERAAGGLARIRDFLATISPERRGVVVMECLTAVFLSQQIPIANNDSRLSHNSVYYYIVSQKWDKGLNLFALAGILLFLGEVLLSVILLRLIVSVCSNFVGSKGKTICRLINSLLLYIALFMFLVKLFEFIGFSKEAIIAAIGTLGLAVSLGAQNFISDIIAGLTFVFEGTFHVGDIVDIIASAALKCHGEVTEIGLRFIRVLDSEGSIITFSNREVKSVKNLTQLKSKCILEVAIPSDQPLAMIEELLNEELPKVALTDRRILSGPEYNGVIALGSGTVTLSISAQCEEEDYSYVRGIVNHAVHSILTEHGYRI